MSADEIPWDDDELYNLELHAPPSETSARVLAAPANEVIKGDGATPFRAGHGYSRRFPTECLPPRMRAYVHDIAVRAQVPVDLPALVMLGMIGAAAAPRMVVRGSAEWVEPTNLYVMCAMASSAGKSPAVGEIKRGAWRAEKAMKAAHAVNVGERVRTLTAEADDLDTYLTHKRITVSLEEKAGADARIKAMRAEVAKLSADPPPAPLFTIDGDTTPEALSAKLAASGGQGAIVDDEGTLLRNLGGQYSGGKTGNLAIFLKGYDCDSYRPSRVTREAAPVDRLALGMILAPQPSFVADMMRNGTMQDAGFVNRFLVSLPGDLLGQRSGRKSTFVDDDAGAPERHAGRAWWAELLESLVAYDVIDSSPDSGSALELNLTREAYDMHAGYVEDFEPRLRAGRGDLAAVANWAGKHAGRVLRLAGVLHLAGGGTPDDRISKETMADAIEIGDWAIEHFTGMGRVVGLSTGAAQIKEHVDNVPAGWCTRTDINNKVFQRRGVAGELAAWIAELVESGEYVHEKLSSGRGRPLEIVRRVDAVVEPS
jgi:hypothetical protein